MKPNQKDDRYDVEEDLANDTKKHDNPNHPSKHGNDVREALADDELNDYLDGGQK